MKPYVNLQHLGVNKDDCLLPGKEWTQGPWKATDGSAGREMGKCSEKLELTSDRRPRLLQRQWSEGDSMGKLEAGRQVETRHG